MEANACCRLKAFEESIGMGDLGEKFEIKKYRSFDDEIGHPRGYSATLNEPECES
jgi:hypothetical protein